MPSNLPSISVPFTDSKGRITPIWHEFLRTFLVATVDGTISNEGNAFQLDAGNGLVGGGPMNTDISLRVGQGPGIVVNADDVSVDIDSQTYVQAVLDDEVLIADISDNNAIRKTTVRDIAVLGGTPGGDDTQIQYNNKGIFGGDTGFTTDGLGAVEIVGSLDVDNVNINGNTISTTDTNGDLTIDPNGTGKVIISGNVSLGNADTIYWTGGSPTTYSIGGAGGTPYMQGQSTDYQFATTASGWSMGVGSGSTVVWSASTGAMTVTGLDVALTNGSLKRSVTATITASTTQTQGQGPLTSDINEVSTCANANDTVTLPAAIKGKSCLVINRGAQTLQVFPASGDDLGAGVDTSTTIIAGSRKWFVAFDSTNWEQVV